MDNSVIQWIVTSFLGIVLTLVGVLLKLFDNRIKTVENLTSELPGVYARRDDVKDMKQEIITALQRIEDKIERNLHG